MNPDLVAKTDLLIVGGGLSGLAIAHWALKKEPTLDYLVVEGQGRSGGAVQSFKKDGYQGEWGPHGFLDNKPATLELLEDLDLWPEVQKAPLKEFGRYLCLKGRLCLVPQSPPTLIKSDLLSWWAKLRVLGDLFIKADSSEQSVSQWAQRRFGPQVLPFIDAALIGTYAGDLNRLSIDAVMPGLRAGEARYGSAIKAVVAQMRASKGQPRNLPQMISFKEGMERLVEQLAQGKKIRLNFQVEQLIYKEGGWLVKSGDQIIEAKRLVLALPIHQAHPLLAPLLAPPGPAPATAQIYNLLLGFGPEAKIPYGFGYLAPAKENRFALGSLFSSHMFVGRVPEGGQLLEVLIGGRRSPEKLELSDAELIEKTLADLKGLIELPNPQFVKVLRPQSAIPQPELGHKALIDWRDRLLKAYPNLEICGFGWDGIGINEVVQLAKKTALGLKISENQIKGVYL